MKLSGIDYLSVGDISLKQLQQAKQQMIVEFDRLVADIRKLDVMVGLAESSEDRVYRPRICPLLIEWATK